MRYDVVMVVMAVLEFGLRIALGSAAFWCMWNPEWQTCQGIQILGLACLFVSTYGKVGIQTISFVTGVQHASDTNRDTHTVP